jgi:hypothetical protein
MLGGIESVEAAIHGVELIGIVLAEALALYVGYGALERVVRPSMRSVLLETDDRTTGN